MMGLLPKVAIIVDYLNVLCFEIMLLLPPMRYVVITFFPYKILPCFILHDIMINFVFSDMLSTHAFVI